MTMLKGLREKRDAALAARHLDVPVAGLEGVVARFRPITVAETQKIAAKYEKAKDKDAANVRMTAEVLGEAFAQLRDADGVVLADGITDELVAEFVPDLQAADVRKLDVMVGLFTEDFPLLKAGADVASWSQGQDDDALRSFTGN